ncbi:ANTAR domain-containing protein [Arthrobacter sp. NQ7]|uniref:ANTAR domain-containing protein n=1 Tax=Arthrobacter sp. NQ7 TaxID=3032303 RepID=UPI00241007C0|nr:ANTAR domain-containing protein [Arthrobacter sp. NQ7]MDJ0458675.1 ANTAR domain-containing protein [Arthrobacter sp. NQ7]
MTSNSTATPNSIAVSHSTSSAPPSAETVNDFYLNCPTGLVEYFFADGVFRWSDDLYRIYGYERGDVVPSMGMALAHIEPADRAAVLAFWDRVSESGGPSSVYVSIRDRKDRQHKLMYSADFIYEGGEPVGVWGVVVDLTQSIHTDRHQLATEAVAASARNRAIIEQAKGILMGRTGATADEAYELISQQSQALNKKVYAIAQEIVDRAARRSPGQQNPRSEQN